MNILPIKIIYASDGAENNLFINTVDNIDSIIGEYMNEDYIMPLPGDNVFPEDLHTIPITEDMKIEGIEVDKTILPETSYSQIDLTEINSPVDLSSPETDITGKNISLPSISSSNINLHKQYEAEKPTTIGVIFDQ